jgi:23S rRNA (pseudouridine1915-N3)-methyltransferase
MLIRLLAAGTRLPAWVEQAYQEYARRLAAEVRLELLEIPTGRGSRGGERLRARAEEGVARPAAAAASLRKAIRASVPRGSLAETMAEVDRMGKQSLSDEVLL